MAETFYSVLGVESDADTEAIRNAYRAQVKETHPDVSDDDDAADTFKRLTAARDVLIDEASRRRYDRVGHAVYVRDHLDNSAWSVESGTSGRSTGSGANGSTGGGASAGSGSTGRTHSSGRTGADDDANAEDYQRYRSSRADAGTSGRDGPGRTGRRRRAGRTGRTTGTDSSGTDTGASDTSAGGTDASGTDTGEYGTWSTDAGQDWAFSGSSTSTATGGHSADPRDRARADGWQAAHAATDAYTPSGFEPTATATDDGVGSLRAALRQVGPWLAFHFVFLISAFVTVWLIMSWIPSVPMLFVSLLLLGATVFFSVLHMVSQVYS